MAGTDGEAKTVYVIAGPNGAGKTTYATSFLPKFVNCREFLNADLIAAGLSPFAQESQNYLAGRLLLQRIRDLAANGSTFGFETTLAGLSYRKILSDLRHNGYKVVVFYLWLPSEELAIRRVEARVAQGGHWVPPRDIRRRYQAGLRNFFRFYRRLADSWFLEDASVMPPSPIASSHVSDTSVFAPSLYSYIQQQAAQS